MKRVNKVVQAVISQQVVPLRALALVLALGAGAALAAFVQNENGVSLRSLRTQEDFSVLEIPLPEESLDRDVSRAVNDILPPSILQQDLDQVLGAMLGFFQVKHVILYNTTYREVLEPFLQASSASSFPQIRQVDASSLRNPAPFLMFGEEGWKQKEEDGGVPFRWMADEASLVYVLPEGKNLVRPLILHAAAQSIFSDATLLVSVNGGDPAFVPLSDFSSEVRVELDGIREGRNEIAFQTKEGCKIPGKGDGRCLSVRLERVSVAGADDIPSGGLIGYGGFYPEEDEKRWMGDHGDIRIFTLDPRRSFVSFEAVSYAKDRTLSVLVNGKKVTSMLVPDGTETQKIGFSLEEQRGENRIELVADGCDRPSLVEANEDTRCLGVQITNLERQEFR